MPDEVGDSVKGSKAGELADRSIVETGTSSYYSALRDASEQPVCKKIYPLPALDGAWHFANSRFKRTNQLPMDVAGVSLEFSKNVVLRWEGG